MKQLTIIAAIVLIAIGGFFLFNNYIYEEKQVETPPTDLSAYFAQKMYEVGTSDGLMPIEGFDADLLMDKIPGLVVDDFDGVASGEGTYHVENGTLEFVRNEGAPITSAEKTISQEGYSMLLENISARLSQPTVTEEDVDALVARLQAE